MIQSLYIKNFALIDELEVRFEKGFNILTGQTGAGKSIIIGALNLILGERADTDMIRQGEKKAIAEAVIFAKENRSILDILQENEIEVSQLLIIRREIRDTGSRAFINDTPVTLNVLREVGDLLVDLHGQHDHQLLLREENHQHILDGFGDISSTLDQFRRQYDSVNELKKQLSDLRKREKNLREKLELYRFQLKELEEAKLDVEEEENLVSEMHRLDNAEELDQTAASILDLGTEGEVNLTDILGTIEKTMEKMARLEPDFENYLKELKSAQISISEMLRFTERYRTQIEFNPQRLEYLRQRQTELNRLQKKYTRNIEELIAYQEELRQNLNLAENFDLEIGKLEHQIRDRAAELSKQAVLLHQQRARVGKKLSEGIVEELGKLGIIDARFEVKLDLSEDSKGWVTIDGHSYSCTAEGVDTVSFYISTNKGESPKSLSKVASGGEISRIMLAIKTIVAREQSLPVMIFDEIDTGISGEISERVGHSMRELSKHCQIIAITHQPQIASQAHKHYSVQKLENDGRTVTRIIALDQDHHIREIAAMMSGAEITEATLTSARELVLKSNR